MTDNFASPVSGLILLLHLLVLVYWLGGDLGAFYASSLVTDSRLSPPARLAAARILNAVDMAPASCLVLALPTGLALALDRHWLTLPSIALPAIAIGSVGWLALVWRLHLTGESSAMLRRLDRSLRWGLMFALAVLGIAGIVGLVALPLFIALKLLVLAGTVALGVMIRGVLGPYIVGYVALSAGHISPEVDAGLRRSLSLAKPMVVAIWALLLAAAGLGISHVG